MAEKMEERMPKLMTTLMSLTMMVFMFQMLQSVLGKVSETTGAPPSAPSVPLTFSDNFDDNVTNPDLWEKVIVGDATATETGGKLDCYTSGATNAGYVTKVARDLANRTIYVDITLDSVNTLYAILQIDPVKATTSSPTLNNDWVRIHYTLYATRLSVLHKSGGGTPTTCYDNTTVPTCTKLRIRESGGTVYFDYYNGTNWVNVFSMSKPAWWNNAYIYIVGATSAGYDGHTYFDNFRCD